MKLGRGRPKKDAGTKLTGVPLGTDIDLDLEEYKRENMDVDPRDYPGFYVPILPGDRRVPDLISDAPLTPPPPESPPPEPPSSPPEEKKDRYILYEVLQSLAMDVNLALIRSEVTPLKEGGNRRQSNFISQTLIDWDERIAPVKGDGAKIVQICKYYPDKEMLATMLVFVNKIINAAYPNENSRAKIFEQLRKDFNPTSEFGKAAKARYLTVGKEVRGAMNADYQKIVAQRHGKQIQLYDTQVYEAIHINKLSTEWQNKYIAVGMMTGARLSEVLWNSSFFAYENEPEWIEVKGVAKQRGKEDKLIKKPVVGGTGKEVVYLVNELREYFRKRNWNLYDPTPEEAAKMTSALDRAINPVVKGMFENWNLTFHALRGLYAEAAYLAYPPDPSTSKAKFVAEVLGHDPNNLTTTLSYQRFKIVPRDPTIRVDIDIPTMVTNLAMNLEEFKRKLEEENVFPVLPKNDVEFFNGDGDRFTLTRQPNRHDKKQQARFNRLEKHIDALEAQGVNPTYRNLQKLGYGTTTIRQYKQKLTQELQ